ncbi:MAG: hypothetical protein AAFU67_00835 [Bacteroidota bacterium]
MKAILTVLLSLFVISLAIAQTDCKPYIPINEGATWEITDYSAKDKATSKTTYKLLEKREQGDEITFTVESTSYDKKDKVVYNHTFEATCKAGTFDFGMSFKMDGQALAAYQNMDVEVDASDYEIPSLDEAPGTQLKDGSLVVGIQGPITMKMKVNITDRKVEDSETITTPAGSFNCVVLSQTVSTKMVVNVEAGSKEWYAPEVGMVRSETYNKKGKLLGYSVLTALDRG